MSWFYALLLIAALGVVVLRIYAKLRAAQKSRTESWDEQMIGRLRSQGYAPFNDYRVDFFLSLPDGPACERTRALLEPEFSVDSKPAGEGRGGGFSLHASKTMRLVVPDMQDIGRRMTAIAAQSGGHYDGWTAGPPENRAAVPAGPGPTGAPPGLQVILKRFESPDEVRDMELGKFELVRLGGMTLGRATYQPGWKWSEHVGPRLGRSRCSVEHVGLVLSGAATASFEDGSVVELRAGQLFHIPAVPHDSWVLGAEPYVSLHFLGADGYAK